jgi:hypothetical protein
VVGSIVDATQVIYCLSDNLCRDTKINRVRVRGPL